MSDILYSYEKYMSLIRLYSHSDFEQVNQIYREHHQDKFGIPSLKNCLRAVVHENDNGRIVAFGMINTLAEVIMVLDLNASNREKAKALRDLIRTSLLTAGVEGFDSIHAFVQGDFAEKLEEHFNFKPIIGRALYRKV